MRAVFRTTIEKCPDCNGHLRAYRSDARHIISAQYGSFTAIHRIRRCRKCGRIFRSEALERLIEPYCTYANDMMLYSAMKRFIDGRSSSEISLESGTGISEREVRNLSNMALHIFTKIHEEAVPGLKGAMQSYILQIDGTTDSEFSMIVAVRDAVSGFVLYVKKCDAESYEYIKGILQIIKDRFGIPSGITCDMGSAMLSAAMEVFPTVPIRICLMHFLRALGKDIMEDMHSDLGKMINSVGIKSHLDTILGEMPDYSQRTLYEIENGFCTDPEKMELMAVRRILQRLLSLKGSSGYGFPFSLKHLNFFIACKEADNDLSELLPRLKGDESRRFVSLIRNQLAGITGNTAMSDMAHNLSEINSLVFQKIRKVFNIPDKGSLSDEEKTATDDLIIHENCNNTIGEMEVYLHTNIPSHLFKAAKKAIERYHERENLLFANNPEHTIPRTNNGMERFFRKVRRNVRKRCGNIVTGNILTQSGESLTLFQNMSNPEYVKIVFGSEDISAFFAKYRKPFKKKGITRKKVLELIDAGTRMILEGSLQDSPYSENMMEAAYASRNITRNEKYRSV